MSWSMSKKSSRTILSVALAMSVAAVALYFGATGNTVEAQSKDADTASTAPNATFPANAGSLGSVPDGAAGCATNGAPKDVTFTVSGLSGAPTNVSVDMTFGAPVHTWRGDITATLIAPNGASHILFGKTGSTVAGGCGSSSDLAGPYTFNDTGATTWWTNLATPTPSGTYRTTSLGSLPTGGTITTMNPAFTGVAAPNGTWTLRLTDGGGGDTGSISAANLTLDAGTAVPADAPVDMNGDGKTDYAVVRNTGGGANGQITWFYNLNGSGGTVGFAWGLATDFFVPEDFDGDNKTDIAIWRPGAPTVAAFYIYNSSNNTVRVEAFGQTGDDPTVVGDYSGDGATDLAVYRGGATAGAPSTWYYRSTPGGPVTFTNWGQNGDFPAPGDYDGDNKNDFVVQRTGSGGQANFWHLLSATNTVAVVAFGTPTDVIVPGDYDGDGKTDIATVRGSGGVINWFYRSSATSSITQVAFGASATDFPAQGDYDGDGRTDFAVWRPSASAGQSAFWTMSSASFAVAGTPFGANGDYPVANYNTH